MYEPPSFQPLPPAITSVEKLPPFFGFILSFQIIIAQDQFKNHYIFIEVPNVNPSYWKLDTLDTPHLYFFTKKSLQNCLDKFGFDLISIETFGNSYEELLSKKKQNYEIQRDDGAYLKALFKKKKFSY